MRGSGPGGIVSQFPDSGSVPISSHGWSVGRPLALAGYPVALLFLLSSLLQEGPRIWPLNFADQGWRFGSLGIVFNGLVTPVLALAIAMGAALLARQRLTLRVLSILALLAAIATVIGLIVFYADFAALAPTVEPEIRPGFRVAAWRGVLGAALAVPVLVWFGIGGWIAARRITLQRDIGRRGGLVVGQPTAES